MSNTPDNAAIIAIPFITVSVSSGSMRIEKAIGNTTDILLATVVIEIPASLDDLAITKNITINKNPISTEIGIQGKFEIEEKLRLSAFTKNPIIEAMR